MNYWKVFLETAHKPRVPLRMVKNYNTQPPKKKLLSNLLVRILKTKKCLIQNDFKKLHKQWC